MWNLHLFTGNSCKKQLTALLRKNNRKYYGKYILTLCPVFYFLYFSNFYRGNENRGLASELSVKTANFSFI